MVIIMSKLLELKSKEGWSYSTRKELLYRVLNGETLISIANELSLSTTVIRTQFNNSLRKFADPIRHTCDYKLSQVRLKRDEIFSFIEQQEKNKVYVKAEFPKHLQKSALLLIENGYSVTKQTTNG